MSPLRVAVVGAGAAGYFAAAAIKRKCPTSEVTVIHDPNTPIVGVGESLAWNAQGFMQHYLGLDNDFKWFRKSESTFKFAISFQGFNGGNDCWFSCPPVNPSIDILSQDSTDYLRYLATDKDYSLYDIWWHLRAKGMGPADPQASLSANYLCARENKSPLSLKNYSTPIGPLYSYHFNANLIGDLVHELVGIPAGVKTIPVKVKQVVLTGDGAIDHLLLDDEQKFHADLFIDASGFARILAKALPYKYTQCDEYFNNTAIVGRHYFKDHTEYKAYTTSMAMDHGWHFSVPVAGKSGEGYVFNSNNAPDVDHLAAELQRTTGKTDVTFRKLSWTPGYYKTPFVKNCVLLGISQGFSEPFDANGFSSTLRQLRKLVDCIVEGEATGQPTSFSWKDNYNKYVSDLADDIIFRLHVTFHLAKKNDTPYWQELKSAEAKYRTKERLVDAIFDPSRKLLPNTGANQSAYQQSTLSHTAIYNNIKMPIERCIINISEETERRALAWFDAMAQKTRKHVESAEPVSEFYKKLYPT